MLTPRKISVIYYFEKNISIKCKRNIIYFHNPNVSENKYFHSNFSH